MEQIPPIKMVMTGGWFMTLFYHQWPFQEPKLEVYFVGIFPYIGLIYGLKYGTFMYLHQLDPESPIVLPRFTHLILSIWHPYAASTRSHLSLIRDGSIVLQVQFAPGISQSYVIPMGLSSNFNWLVVDLPLWKIWQLVSWDDEIANIWELEHHHLLCKSTN